jgi:tetratricopeptide (TPR) repeat protein
VRPSEPSRLSKLLRGELDCVIMKALEKDRNRRYETANDFAADVQRYLAGEAVLAVPPSTGYRLRKFARRNRRVLATAGVLLVAALVAVGATAGSVGWAARGRAARQAAVEKEAELALAEAERRAEQEKWHEALEAVKRGEGLLAGGGAAFRRGADVDPNSPQAHLYLAEVLLDLGEYADTARTGRTAIRLGTRVDGPGIQWFGEILNRIARRLVLDPDPKARNPVLTVEFAREAIRLNPLPKCWMTLGVAEYRAGGFGAAVSALERSMELRHGAPAFDWFVLALSHRHLGNTDGARRWYDNAVAWADTNRPTDKELYRFRAEAEESFRIEAAPPPRTKP